MTESAQSLSGKLPKTVTRGVVCYSKVIRSSFEIPRKTVAREAVYYLRHQGGSSSYLMLPIFKTWRESGMTLTVVKA